MFDPEIDAAMGAMYGPQWQQQVQANTLRGLPQALQGPQGAPSAVAGPLPPAPLPSAPPVPPQQGGGGLPLATGRARPVDLYQQAADIRARAYGLRPDLQMIAAEREKADANARAGMVMQMLGGSRLAPVGGAVLQQALRRQGELELDPEREAARDFRALEMQAQALERQATLTQAAEDRAALQREALAARAEAARERAADRAALASIAAGNRTERDAERKENERFKREQALGADYEKAMKDISAEISAADKMLQLSAKDSRTMTAQDQQGLIFSFMKMLDPGSVVRESEYAAAARARGVFDAAANYLTQLQTGKPLTPTQVANLRRIATDYKQAALDLKAGVDTTFNERAQRWGVDPTGVTRSMGAQPSAPQRPRFERRASGASPADGPIQLPY